MVVLDYRSIAPLSMTRGTSARSALVAGFNDIGATFVAHADGAARRNFNPLLDEGRQVAASLFETSDA